MKSISMKLVYKVNCRGNGDGDDFPSSTPAVRHFAAIDHCKDPHVTKGKGWTITEEELSKITEIRGTLAQIPTGIEFLVWDKCDQLWYLAWM